MSSVSNQISSFRSMVALFRCTGPNRREAAQMLRGDGRCRPSRLPNESLKLTGISIQPAPNQYRSPSPNTLAANTQGESAAPPTPSVSIAKRSLSLCARTCGTYIPSTIVCSIQGGSGMRLVLASFLKLSRY